MIARFYIGYILSDRFDHTGAFMTQNTGAGDGIQAFDEMQITVADAGIDRAHQHFPPRRLINFNFLNSQGLMGRPHYRSFRFHHSRLPMVICIVSNIGQSKGQAMPLFDDNAVSARYPRMPLPIPIRSC